jgi:hypothetical protein
VQKLRDFSQEEIQNAAEEVRRSNFGDFMFRDPGFNRGTSGRRTTRRNTSRNRQTSRRNTSRKRVTTRRHTSRRHTSRRHTSSRHTSRRVTSRHLRCFNSNEGNYLVRRCFDGSNMALFIRRKR